MTASVPAGPTDAQAQLREEIARAIEASDQAGLAAALASDLGGVDDPYGRNADAVLALPAVRDALAAQEAVKRVRDVVAKAGPMMPRASVRRALDGNW